MQIKTHKSFDKMWAKLDVKSQQKVLKSLELLKHNKNNPKLRLHQLRGNYYPQFSISAGGDLRIHYLELDINTIVLVLVGTHSQLYG